MKTEKFQFKPEDLMIGSLTYYHAENGEMHLNVIDWEDIKLLVECPEYFNKVHSPIPLNHEMLLDCGFSDEDYKPGYIGKDFKSGGMILDFVLSKPYSKGEWNTSYTFDLVGHRFVPFLYVHEFQRFYRALTGENLEIKTLQHF